VNGAAHPADAAGEDDRGQPKEDGDEAREAAANRAFLLESLRLESLRTTRGTTRRQLADF
jgi:hypothetical protein